MSEQSWPSSESVTSSDIVPILSPVLTDSNDAVPTTPWENPISLSSYSQLKLVEPTPFNPQAGERRPYTDNPSEAGATGLDNTEASTVEEPYIYRSNSRRQGQNRARRGSITESITASLLSFKDMTLKELRRDRFIIIGIFSVICLIVFQMVFLGRSSLERDLRRLHGQKVTFAESSRILLSSIEFNNTSKDNIINYVASAHSIGEGHTYIQNYLTQLGFDPHIDSHFLHTELPSPAASKVEFQGKVFKSAFIVPGSPSANVKGPLLYLNYGDAEDYQRVTRHKIFIKNTIVIIRYVDQYSIETQINLASENGALGVIVYNDPADDGEITLRNGFKQYPDGPSINYSNVNKFAIKSNVSIPVISMSVNDIQNLLGEGNPGPNLKWVGDLDFNYKPGPSVDEIEFEVTVENTSIQVNDLINELSGFLYDEEIIIGCSIDTVDGQGGASGCVPIVLELARGFSDLLKVGWKPLRTIRFILWDGSNFENVDLHSYSSNANNVKAMSFINLGSVKGQQLHIETNPMLNDVIKETFHSIHLTNVTSSIHPLVHPFKGFQYETLGVPVLDVGYKSNGKSDPVWYQSSLDDLNWIKMFDPDFRLHNKLAQFAAKLVLNLSEKELPPLRLADYFTYIYDKFDKSFPHEDQQDEVYTQIRSRLQKCAAAAKKFDDEMFLLHEKVYKDYPWYFMMDKIRIAKAVKSAKWKMDSINDLFVTKTHHHLVWSGAKSVFCGDYDTLVLFNDRLRAILHRLSM